MQEQVDGAVEQLGQLLARFLADPLQRMFLLGLAAIADRDDGVAQAALLRPPFFAVDFGDLARARADDPGDLATQARTIVSELRRRRFERSVGATARALLEETAFGRVLALGPNGGSRLQGIRELCLQLESIALEEKLDFDTAVERIRGWISQPRQLERPHPVGSDVVRVLTVHQAKGLEFPAVVLWDACATWDERGGANEAWLVERDGRGWTLDLDGLRWEHPPGNELETRERAMREAERKRLVYVAATRARDLLIVPSVSRQSGDTIFGRLLGQNAHATLVVAPVHAPNAHAAWYTEAGPASPPSCTPTERDVGLRAAWNKRCHEAGQGRLRPVAFSDAKAPRVFWGRAGRFGTTFGTTVHEAIGLALSGVAPDVAVARVAASVGLRRNLADATEDVHRALATLDVLGVSSTTGAFRLEYPVAGRSATGELVAGYVDLVALTATGPFVLDFKTDAPSGQVADAYAAQVQGYARVVAAGLGLDHLRTGLLFTSDGSVHWLSSENDGVR